MNKPQYHLTVVILGMFLVFVTYWIVDVTKENYTLEVENKSLTKQLREADQLTGEQRSVIDTYNGGEMGIAMTKLKQDISNMATNKQLYGVINSLLEYTSQGHNVVSITDLDCFDDVLY